MKGGTCVITLRVVSGQEQIRESLSWRLGRGFPEFDVIASNGSTQFRLRSAVLEPRQLEDVRSRVERLVARLNEYHPSEIPLEIEVRVEQ
jgi:hypothetical protein